MHYLRNRCLEKRPFFFLVPCLFLSLNLILNLSKETSINGYSKHPRFNKSLLYRPKPLGGLGLLNLWHYFFLAARLTQTTQCHAPILDISWLRFGMHAVLPYHLSGLLWSKSIQVCNIAPLTSIVYQSLYL